MSAALASSSALLVLAAASGAVAAGLRAENLVGSEHDGTDRRSSKDGQQHVSVGQATSAHLQLYAWEACLIGLEIHAHPLKYIPMSMLLAESGQKCGRHCQCGAHGVKQTRRPSTHTRKAAENCEP